MQLTVLVATPRPTSAAFVRFVTLPGGRWLVATSPRGPLSTSERRLAFGLVLGAVAVAALVVLASRTVLRQAARPLERMVGWANAFSPEGGPTATEDEDNELMAQAYRRIARDLRTRSEELHDTKAAFRLALERLGDALASTHDMDGIVEVMVETSLLVLPADAAVYYRLVGPPANLAATHARGVSIERLVLDGSGLAGPRRLYRRARHLARTCPA